MGLVSTQAVWFIGTVQFGIPSKIFGMALFCATRKHVVHKSRMQDEYALHISTSPQFMSIITVWFMMFEAASINVSFLAISSDFPLSFGLLAIGFT